MLLLIIVIIVLWLLLKHNSNKDNINSNNNSPKQNRKGMKLADVYDLGGKAGRGDREAQYNLGTLFYYGDGVAKNYKIAADWYQKATYQGHTKAAYALGMMYLHGVGVEQDGKRAVELFYIASQNGLSEAKATLEQMKNEGREVDSIIEQYKRKAERKNNSCCDNNGFPTVNNPTVKMNDNRLANDNQQAYQLFRKGWDYEQGNGVKADITLAMDYYRKAADLGSEIATYRLNKLNEQGQSYEKKISNQQTVRSKGPEKVSNVNKPAVKNNDDRQAYQFYKRGWDCEHGNDADIALAMDFYRRAAALGSEIATYRLKFLNAQKNTSLNKDINKAQTNVTNNPKINKGKAYYDKAYKYENGIGVVADKNFAMAMY